MEVEVTWGKTIKFWWAWMWRAMLLALAGGLLIGVLFGIISALLGIQAPILSGILSFLVGIFSSFYMLKKVLNKDFGDFRIVLISKSEEGINKK